MKKTGKKLSGRLKSSLCTLLVPLNQSYLTGMSSPPRSINWGVVEKWFRGRGIFYFCLFTFNFVYCLCG